MTNITMVSQWTFMKIMLMGIVIGYVLGKLRFQRAHHGEIKHFRFMSLNRNKKPLG